MMWDYTCHSSDFWGSQGLFNGIPGSLEPQGPWGRTVELLLRSLYAVDRKKPHMDTSALHILPPVALRGAEHRPPASSTAVAISGSAEDGRPA